MNRKAKLLLLFAAFVGLAIAIVPRKSYQYSEHALPASFDEFYQANL